MAAKITKLTPAQESDLRRTYDEWLAIGRSVSPLDATAALEAIAAMYARIGEPRPPVLFFSSPLMCVLAYGTLRSLMAPQSEGKKSGAKGDQLRSQLWDQLWGQIRDQLRGQLWGQLRDQLRDQLWGQLSGQLGWTSYFAGNQWCAWEVFYGFCRRIGVKYTEDQNALLDLWLTQSRTCHWWWPYKGIVLASARPTALNVDEQGRLHASDGPAIAYADGWSVYAWHGVRLNNPDIIEHPECITIDQVQQEANAEIRRVMLERYGFDRFIVDSGAVPIHADDVGTLYRTDFQNDEPLVCVSVLNSTPEADGHFKRYTMRVDQMCRPLLGNGEFGKPQQLTARNAVASTFGLRGEQYAPAVEA